MTLLIVFNDGTERRIENVRTAGLESVDCFMFTEGNDRGRAFVPKENVRYFGPEELWVEPEKAADWDEIITCVESCRVNEFEAFSYDTAIAQNYLLNLVIANLNRMRKRKNN